MGQHMSTDVRQRKEITFTIQEQPHIVSYKKKNVTAQTSLLTYLRDMQMLKDTKAMCREGGCGACIVAATFTHPHSGRQVTRAVNSCLVPVLAIHNWSITTCHGIGNREIGYHPIQEALAKHNGSQCGFCSSGMVMNMYSLTESKDLITMADVEDSFAGNLCRCTGYRPIMDAFKSLANVTDIEDLKICPKTNKACAGQCEDEQVELVPFCLELDAQSIWYKVYTIQNILDLFNHIGSQTYRLVAGNTGQGVYKIINPPNIWIDITNVKELASYTVEDVLKLGGNVTLTDTMDLMLKLSEEDCNFWYMKQMHKHFNLVATIPIGTLAGNLSLKHDHHNFPSDVFLLMETIGAKITIVDQTGQEIIKTVAEYICFNMNKCILKSITLPSLNQEVYLFKTYKIMPRAQNAHAYVNAGFLIQFEDNQLKNITSSRIVFGGINSNFIHATNTEKYLIGKNLFTDEVLQGALEHLTNELNPDYVLPDATPEFRKNLARNLFYKFILFAAPKDQLNPRYVSGGFELEHKLMKGTQFFQTDETQYPITKPVNKIEALWQCSGEAQYINDLPAIHGELFGAFVLAETVPTSTISSIDTTKALAMPGVVTFVDHKDVPGKNLFSTQLNPTEEILFCEGNVLYNGQPVGVILADTYERAIAAAANVQITYNDPTGKPEYTIEEVLVNNDTGKISVEATMNPTSKGTNTKYTIQGKMMLKGQYHFHMETQRTICVPVEGGGYEMYAGTQWMDQVQMAAAQALDISMDKISVIVRRLGGAFGAKILRASLVSTACVVACHKVHRPVRILLPLDVNMKMIGKRFPTYGDYEVETDENGVIQQLKGRFFQNAGISGGNEKMVQDIPHYIRSAYEFNTWELKCALVTTEMAGSAYCRSPGASEAIAYVENIMDHIANVTGKSLDEVRRNNFLSSDSDMTNAFETAIKWAEFDSRKQEIETFNKENRWIKKGLGVSVMDYHLILFYPYSVIISVYAGDGSVAISHGGIECGQGINTKAVQVCAKQFNIPMEQISVKPSNTLTSPNNLMTGGSVTSEGVCYAVIEACGIILKRLEPIRDKMNNPTWKELVWQAKADDVQLCATGIFVSNSEKAYSIPGICVSEVTVDVLTGVHTINRVDLYEDAGQSISPALDVGQIEGAFIMGLGNYVHENLVYDYNNGQLMTYNTWTYKVPGVKDTPEDFRIMFKQNSSNPGGVLNSKATGEPALSLSIGVPFSIRQALIDARKEAAPNDPSFFDINGPVTVEYTLLNSCSNYKDYKL